MSDINNETNVPQNDVVAEAGPSEGSLKPGGGTGAGDVRMRTIADIVAQLGTASDEDLNNFKASIAQIGHEADPVGDSNHATNMASVKTKPSSASMKGMVKEDLTRIFGAEETLSEGFIDNATTLFEAALDARVELERQAIAEQADQAIQEGIQEAIASFSERLDVYLDYCAEEFLAANQLAVEQGIRHDIADSLMEGFRNVFLEHNVVIPETGEDMVEQLSEEVNNLRAELNEAVAAKLELEGQIEEAVRAATFEEVTEGLIDSDRDRLRTLSENVEFVSEDTFRDKLNLLKETFIVTTPANNNGLVIEEVGLQEEIAESAQTAPVNGPMASYAAAISRSTRR